MEILVWNENDYMKKSIFIIPVIIIIVGILLSVYYENNPTPKTSSVSNNNQQMLRVSSSAFENEGTIPAEFTCDGQDISPPLSITNIPKDVKTLSLIMTDPDAPRGNFTHWTVWNIPSSKIEFAKGEKFDFPQGRTGFGTPAYGGPCPPSGTHRYLIKIYALDAELDLAKGSSVTDLQKAMDGHIITESTLMGKYSRN
ncbi:MAG: YbhB/YbcL family Raf kinase inhibitor-like protein [Candidatus Nitrosotalea sp.]|nr:YbhB/YbcL family Raf kinase inhibitor-like protein [Candidatus Nitrosotalea sp.]